MRSASSFLPLWALSTFATFAAMPSALAQTPAPAPLPALPSDAPASPAPAAGAPAAPGSEAVPTSPAPTAPPANASPLANPPPPPPVSVDGHPEMPLRWRPRLRHDGFYLAVGSGSGLVGMWGSGPHGSASLSGFGSSSSVAIGGSLAPGLSLAGVIQGGTTSGTFNGGPTIVATTTQVLNGTPKTTTTNLSGHANGSTFLLGAQIDWYPRAEDGWHAGAAIGLGGASVTDDAGNTSTGASIAGSLFGGYQWWLGPAWSLGLLGVVTTAPSLKLDDSNQNDTGYRLTPASVSLQVELLYY